MATSGADGVKGVVGGIFTLAVVAGVIYLKVVKAQNRAERREARDAAFEADHSLWKSHALDMMKQAPDAKGIGEYLAWGVETYHGEADEEAMSSFISDGAAYRDALIEKIYERARKDGREDVTRSLDKVRTMAKLADPDQWWVIQKKKK